MDDVPKTKEDIIKNLLIVNQMYCTACEVKVNTEKDWNDHLESKKHKKFFERELKKQMKFWEIVDEEEEKKEQEKKEMASAETVSEPTEKPKKLSRAQKRHQKKREQIKKQEEEEKQHTFDINESRNQEIELINNQLTSLNMHVVCVPADGNCLYHAIAKQLGLTNNDYNQLKSYQMAAEAMRKNIDDYAPFLEENIDIHAYIDDVEHSSKWGGQLEIKAISEGYKVPIMVYSANQSPLLMGEQFTGEPLRISYHLQYLTLGNHYNTILPM